VTRETKDFSKMAERLSELYNMLVQFQIPPKDVERFVLDLAVSNRAAQKRCREFLVKYKVVIETGAAAMGAHVDKTQIEGLFV
jgi:hypothetical protein